MGRELVIYHDNCFDGFTSAWIARKAMPEATFFGGIHGHQPPWKMVKDSTVFVLDFSYPREVMEKMFDLAKDMLVLDHHESARIICEGLAFCHFDMERSGAGLTWDYFYPNKARPLWVNIVEDRDLWLFKFDETKAVHAYMASLQMTFRNWDKIAHTPISQMRSAGVSILRYINQQVNLMAKEYFIFNYREHVVAAVNCPYNFASSTADRLINTLDVDYAMAWFMKGDGTYQFSLRSLPDTIDVSIVAKDHGGGGHKCAAGFSMKFLPIEFDFKVNAKS